MADTRLKNGSRIGYAYAVNDLRKVLAQVERITLSLKNIYRLLMNDDLKEAYFIELKSSKIRHAYEQINKTIRMARESLHGYEMYKRIVFNGKVTIGVTQSWLIRERIKAGKSSRGRDRLRYERALMEECINEDF